jgi:hypothetical protein
MKDQDLYCHYSDLPSPTAYVNHNNTVSKKKKKYEKSNHPFFALVEF